MRGRVKLATHEIETGCGHAPQFSDWLFQYDQHALLSIEQGSMQVPCKKCLEVIDKVAQQEVKLALEHGMQRYAGAMQKLSEGDE